MSAGFDPYYKWLGIPPKDQPPHHYRLLGIECFEPDAEVIDAAANRVMSYLQNLSVGEHAEPSQRLLNEIAAARLCLLDTNKKSRYDQSLREKSSATRTTPPVRRESPPARPAPAIEPSATVSLAPQPFSPSSRSGLHQPTMASKSATVRTPRTDERRIRQRRNHLVAVVLLSIVFVALLSVGYHVITNDDQTNDRKTSGDRSAASSDAETRDKKSTKSKNLNKSETSLPPLSTFDPNKAPTEETDEPAPNLSAQSSEVFAAWMADADKAIREKRFIAAIEILERYLRYGDAPQRSQAVSWRDQCRYALLGEQDADFLLAQMGPEQRRALEQGVLVVDIDGLKFTRPVLEQAFYNRLRERHAARKKDGG